MAQRKIQIDIEKAAELARKGLSLEQTALALGVSSKTLQRRRKEVSELSTVLSRARAGAEGDVADVLWSLMHDETAPHVVRLKAAVFWLERRGKGWTQAAAEGADGDDAPKAVPVKIDVKISDPDPDSPEMEKLRKEWQYRYEVEHGLPVTEPWRGHFLDMGDAPAVTPEICPVVGQEDA